jgi:hypothetical protein
VDRRRQAFEGGSAVNGNLGEYHVSIHAASGSIDVQLVEEEGPARQAAGRRRRRVRNLPISLDQPP